LIKGTPFGFCGSELVIVYQGDNIILKGIAERFALPIHKEQIIAEHEISVLFSINCDPQWLTQFPSLSYLALKRILWSLRRKRRSCRPRNRTWLGSVSGSWPYAKIKR